MSNAFIQFINKENKMAKMKFEMVKDNMENAHKLDYNNVAPDNPAEIERLEELYGEK